MGMALLKTKTNKCFTILFCYAEVLDSYEIYLVSCFEILNDQLIKSTDKTNDCFSRQSRGGRLRNKEGGVLFLNVYVWVDMRMRETGR
jgi:hypothetical protein